MGVNDGAILGKQKILDNGPDDQRMNLVLVAEGFREDQQGFFETLCDELVTVLKAEPWYPAIGIAINVHRLNVASTDEGADDPVDCEDEPGDGTVAATYFDATFCANGLTHRCLAPDFALVDSALDDNFPTWWASCVIVNTNQRGGCSTLGGGIFSTGLGAKPGEHWTDIALHEFGHSAFELADEYNYYSDCEDDEPGHDVYDGSEPSVANITTATSLAELEAANFGAKKIWRYLITPEVPVPTMENPDCSKCDERPNVLSSDYKIGLFEGAGGDHCGLYRPAYMCRMRKADEPFCAVCVQCIAVKLSTFITPEPRMEVVTGNGSPVLDFGSVVHGLTMHRSFEVRNNRVNFPGQLRVDLSAVMGQFSYAPGTLTTFTLPAPVTEPYTARQIFVAFTSPDAGGPDFNGGLTVTTPDDPFNPNDEVDLLAKAVPPEPIDSVLVFDRSGSMSEATGAPGQRKVDLAVEAGKLYVALLKDNDRVGLARFNDVADDPADILLDMEVVGAEGDGQGRDDANEKLTSGNLNPSGNTSVGAGILLGSEVLDSAAAASRALIVLTDGRQNTDPDIPEAAATVSAKVPKQRVFAVGLGLNQLEDKLVQIASVTNGVAQITGDLVGYKEFLLQKLYVQILSDVSDEAFVKDPLSVVVPGQKRATKIYLGEVDVAADFIVVFRWTPAYPKHIRLWLEAPDGTIVTPADADALPNVQFFTGRAHMFFRWVFPAFPDRPTAHIGRWRVWVENISPGPSTDPLTGVVSGGEPFYYSVMCKARSDLRLGGYLIQTSYAPGSKMTVVLEPTVYGQPLKLDWPPEVRVVRPDESTRKMVLSPGESGEYRGDFSDTPLVGPYLFSTEVTATSPGGNRVTRFRQFTGLIFYPGRPDGGGGGGGGHGGGGGGGGEGDCKEARELIRRLSEIIERCCCGGQHASQTAGARLTTELLLDEIRRRFEGK
ncbi:MAG TPA: M64 family metallopeptidase [Pyrinomonadaceae bacterium]|nr:M64 family metallopeptidase [Pyrinomonadaceae bacterium]